MIAFRALKAQPAHGYSVKPNARSSFSLQFVIAAAVFFLLTAQTELRAQSSTFPCSADDAQYCAGAINPIGKPADATVFPIDGMAVFAPGQSNSDETIISTFLADPQGTAMVQTSDFSTVPFSPTTYFAAASGKIIAPGPQTAGNFGYPEDVVYAWRTGNNVQVNFANSKTDAKYGNIQLPPNTWDGYKIAPQLDLPTYGATNDHIAIAVGDLDGAIDSNGETSDEVVVAFPAWDQAAMCGSPKCACSTTVALQQTAQPPLLPQSQKMTPTTTYASTASSRLPASPLADKCRTKRWPRAA